MYSIEQRKMINAEINARAELRRIKKKLKNLKIKTDRYGKIVKKRVEKQKSKIYGNTPQARFRSYIWGAKIRNLSFNITYEEFMTFWQRRCSYCGDHIETIGIDRRHPMFGYEMDNIVSCCTRCNMMKMAMTEDEFLNKCRKICELNKLH